MLAAACPQAAPDETVTETPVAVSVEEARTAGIREVIAAIGVVSAAPGAELTVTTPEPARIAELPKAEGDHVSAGDVLVRFDIPSLAATSATSAAAIDQARARVDNAKAAADRLAGLVERGVAARKEVEDAQRDLREATAELAQAEGANTAATAMAARAVVRAPFAGVIAKRWHNPGDLVEPGTGDPIVRLVDPSRLEIVAAVPVAMLSKVAVNAPARVVDAGGAQLDASVLTRPAAIEPGSATAPVRLHPASPRGLVAGVTMQVEISGEEHRNAVVIPSAAVVHDGGETIVMTVDKDSKAHRVAVEVGIETGDTVEITKGLTAGDRVIVRGQNGLPDGATVIIES
jgi:RND family efflux transporter MFP subunit